MKKLILILIAGLALNISTKAQSAADPDINILMVPAFVPLNSITGIIDVSTCNNGNKNIVANSLRITVSIGTNAEILGLGTPTDTRWTVLNITSGTNNTIQLTNSGGSMPHNGATQCANITLRVKGTVMGGPSTITGTIGYISGINPLLAPPAPNSSQGNSSTSNDNSTTSLLVTAQSTLPVKLASFDAIVNKCMTTLNWKSSTEVNFSNYQVEYSKDGVNFETVSTVNGKGDNATYSLVHSPAQGKAYYRLKMIDVDTKSEYSRIIVLNINCSKGSVVVYPNPASEVLNVNIVGADDKGTVASLFNQSGQVVLSKNLPNGSNELDIRKLATGIYQLRLVNNTGTENIKIVKD